MKRPTRRSLASVALAALALVALLTGAPGCGRDDDGSTPLTGTCVVNGRVGGCSADLSVRVIFEDASPRPGEGTFSLATGTSGGYQIELPAGDYLAYVSTGGGSVYYARTGPVVRRDLADTLRLRASDVPRVVDFRTGALRISTAVPVALANAQFEFTAHLETAVADAPEFIRYTNEEVANGRLEAVFPILIPGDYTVSALWEQDYSQKGDWFWLPAASVRAEAARYHVSADSVTFAAPAFANPPVRVSGRVTGAWQAFGMSAPYVRLVSPDSTLELAGEWRVALDGSWAIDLCVPRPFRLQTEVGGARLWYGGLRRQDSPIITPQPGQDVPDLDIVGGGVHVRAALDIPGSLYSHATFEFFSPADLTPAGTWSASLKNQFGLANVPAGAWLLRVSRPADDYHTTRWRGQWFDRAGTAAAATPVLVPAGGGIVTIDLALEMGGVIVGVGTDAADDDWRKAILTRADATTVVASRYIFSSEYDFRFSGLEDGTYRLGITPARARVDGDVPPPGVRWYPGTTDWAAAADLTIAGADSIGGLRLAVP
jgi:hypothetical protein